MTLLRDILTELAIFFLLSSIQGMHLSTFRESHYWGTFWLNLPNFFYLQGCQRLEMFKKWGGTMDSKIPYSHIPPGNILGGLWTRNMVINIPPRGGLWIAYLLTSHPPKGGTMNNSNLNLIQTTPFYKAKGQLVRQFQPNRYMIMNRNSFESLKNAISNIKHLKNLHGLLLGLIYF